MTPLREALHQGLSIREAAAQTGTAYGLARAVFEHELGIRGTAPTACVSCGGKGTLAWPLGPVPCQRCRGSGVQGVG